MVLVVVLLVVLRRPPGGDAVPVPQYARGSPSRCSSRQAARSPATLPHHPLTSPRSRVPTSFAASFAAPVSADVSPAVEDTSGPLGELPAVRGEFAAPLVLAAPSFPQSSGDAEWGGRVVTLPATVLVRPAATLRAAAPGAFAPVARSSTHAALAPSFGARAPAGAHRQHDDAPGPRDGGS
jgi:hypothetical protein